MMWFFTVIFFVPGAIMLGKSLGQLVRARQSASWPTVEATIVRSEVEENQGEGVTYGPKVCFAYAVAGKAYESTRLRLGLPLYASKSWAQGIIDRYPTGSRVTAAFDPEQPSFSVLEPGSHALLYGCIVFFSLFVAVGIYTFSIAMGWAHFK